MMMTVQEMIEQGNCPSVVYDANGVEIRKAITAFDTETGEVQSLCFNEQGLLVSAGKGVQRRVEFYPPPLLWKKVPIEASVEARRNLWDLEGK